MKDVLLMPVKQVGVTNPFTGKDKHNGVDLGWLKNPYQPIFACQHGKVVDVFTNSSTGNAIVIEHDYGNGEHRWTGYIHLHKLPTLKVGALVKQGQQIGIMGNTGRSNGNHLHLYTTKITTVKYTWSRMKARVIDPLPLLYCDKSLDYKFASAFKPKWIQDVIVYPETVKRDETKHQVEIKSDTRNLRSLPSLTASIYDKYCKRGIYYAYEFAQADGYKWARIGEDFWVAVMSTDGDYPVVDYKTKCEELEKEVKTLKQVNDDLKRVNASLEKEVEFKQGQLDEIYAITIKVK